MSIGGHQVPGEGTGDDGFDEEGYDESQRAEILEVTRDGPSDGTLLTDIAPDIGTRDDDDDDLEMEDDEVGEEDPDADESDDDEDEDDVQDELDGNTADDDDELSDRDDAALRPLEAVSRVGLMPGVWHASPFCDGAGGTGKRVRRLSGPTLLCLTSISHEAFVDRISAARVRRGVFRDIPQPDQ